MLKNFSKSFFDFRKKLLIFLLFLILFFKLRNVFEIFSRSFNSCLLSKKFLNLKNKIKNTNNINYFLQKTKKNLEKFFNIKIEYLENRNTKNLTISNKYKGSKIFLSYYYKNIRLIDNF